MTQNLDFASTKEKDSVGRIDLGGVTGKSFKQYILVSFLIICVVTDTLASMLGRTTSLLPNALFASLGMPREESMSDVKHVSIPIVLLMQNMRRLTLTTL